jgi:hypothetical protein
MDLLTWLIVGLVAGVLASMVMGGTGYGLVGDIIMRRVRWRLAAPGIGNRSPGWRHRRHHHRGVHWGRGTPLRHSPDTPIDALLTLTFAA